MGEDGPTHQPVEQLVGLRSIPSMVVVSPADANETGAAWRIAIDRDGPVTLVLTRQGLPVLDLSAYAHLPAGVLLGGYVLADFPADARRDIILIATGSEVHLALAARNQLALDGIGARVVSLPSTELFAQQPKEYRDSVLALGVDLLAIKAGVSLGRRSYVGPQIAVIAVDTFGASAPGSVGMEHYGFNVNNVCSTARAVIGHEYQL